MLNACRWFQCYSHHSGRLVPKFSRSPLPVSVVYPASAALLPHWYIPGMRTCSLVVLVRDLTFWPIVGFQTSHLVLCNLFLLLEKLGWSYCYSLCKGFSCPVVEGAFQGPQTGAVYRKCTTGSPTARMTWAASRRLPWLIPAGRHRWHLSKHFTATCHGATQESAWLGCAPHCVPELPVQHLWLLESRSGQHQVGRWEVAGQEEMGARGVPVGLPGTSH